MAGYEENIYEDELVDLPQAPLPPPKLMLDPPVVNEIKNDTPVKPNTTKPNYSPQQQTVKCYKDRALTIALVVFAAVLLCAAVIMSAYALAKYADLDKTTNPQSVEPNENEKAACQNNPCKNNGKCVTVIQGGYYCICDSVKSYGRYCENVLNERNTLLFPHSCLSIKQADPMAKSGIYLIQILGTDKKFPVYCDQETEGGGWTLAWRYGFTNYENFGDISNAVTPIPFWNSVSPFHLVSDVEHSATPPLGESERGAVEFTQWKKIGSEFMVKSNINNWIKCLPSGGSLVEMKNGAIKCEVIKTIYDCPSSIPPVIVVVATNYNGPLLCTLSTNNAGRYYYYWVGSTTKLFPIHDPCGRSGQNQVTNVEDPYGAVYIR